MSGVQVLEVDADGQGQRLDRWFRRVFPQVTQGRVEKLCRKGEIRVDGGRVKAATRLEAGQSVRVPPLPDVAAPPVARDNVDPAQAEMIRSLVLYRDDHIIALNKPPGLAVQVLGQIVDCCPDLAVNRVGVGIVGHAQRMDRDVKAPALQFEYLLSNECLRQPWVTL